MYYLFYKYHFIYKTFKACHLSKWPESTVWEFSSRMRSHMLAACVKNDRLSSSSLSLGNVRTSGEICMFSVTDQTGNRRFIVQTIFQLQPFYMRADATCAYIYTSGLVERTVNPLSLSTLTFRYMYKVRP